jgi:hypothetical protein
MEQETRKKLLVVKNSETEAKVIEDLARLKGLSESNLIRRLIKAEAEVAGFDVENLFSDGFPGNRLPKPRGKEDRATRVNECAVAVAEVGMALPTLAS